MKFDGLLLSKRYIPSPKTYTEDLSYITFNFLYENSLLEPRVSFSSNFALLFSVIRLILLYFFIWIFICFGQKEPTKVQIFRLSTARMKINQIPFMSSFKPQINFPLNFASPFSVMIHNRLKSFNWHLLWTKIVHQCIIFQTFESSKKVHTIPHAIFKTRRSGFIQILHHCSVFKISHFIFETASQFQFCISLLCHEW